MKEYKKNTTDHLMEHHVHKDLIVHMSEREVPHSPLEDQIIMDLPPYIVRSLIQQVFISVQFTKCSIICKKTYNYIYLM